MLNNVICFVTLLQFPVFLEFYNNFTIPSLAACTFTHVHLARRYLQRLQKHILIEASFARLR